MTTKKWLFAILGLIFLLAVVFYFIYSSQSNQQVVSLSGEKVIAYSASGGSLKVLNNTTGKFEYLADLSLEKNDEIGEVVFSPNGKSYLYSTVYNLPSDQILEEEDEVEARSVYFSGKKEPSIFNAYSPVWLSSNKIIYQDCNSYELVIYSVREQKEISRHDFDFADLVEIFPLEENSIIALPATYDVSKITSQTINLESGKIKNYLTGLGLEIKTILGTDFLAYQIIDSENKSETKVINWRDGTEITKTNQSAGLLVWDKEGRVKYLDSKSNKLIDLTAP